MLLCMFAGLQGANAQDVSNWSELTNAIQNATTPININNNITNDGTTGLGTLGGSDNTVTINGNMYDINGSSLGGITVNDTQTLNINNVGTNDSDGFNGFEAGGDGGAITNYATANITNKHMQQNYATCAYLCINISIYPVNITLPTLLLTTELLISCTRTT